MRKSMWSLAAMGVTLVAVGLGVGLWPDPREHMALPPNAASPEQVVTAVVAAWEAHDSETVKALYDPRFLPILARLPNGGLTPYGHVTLVAIDGKGPYATDPSLGGLRPGEKVMQVGTTLDVLGSHASTPDGKTPLDFILVRTGPGKAWRVYETGLG